MPETQYTQIPDSARSAPQGSVALSTQEDAEVIEVTLRLRSRLSGEALGCIVAQQGNRWPRQRTYLTREVLKEAYGADASDVLKIGQFAHQHELTITQVHRSSRVVRLRGSVRAMRAAFRADLRTVSRADGTYRVREGAVWIPVDLKGIVVGVHGLDERPMVKPHLGGQPPAVTVVSTWPLDSLSVADVAKAYNFPTELDGSGQCIALIEFNGIDKAGRAVHTGYDASDLKSFFEASDLAMPDISVVGVDGGANMPGQPGGRDHEVVLDIEIAAAVAPKARIVVYFAPNTTSGVIDALKSAIHDTERKPSVISISWGGTEDPGGQMAKAYLDAVNEALRDAAAVGVTVCISSGDEGSADMSAQDWDGKAHVAFPASSPFALACGGTRLTLVGGDIQDEVVWNEGRAYGAGGGGVSSYFPLPDYQMAQGVPTSSGSFSGRGVPDLAGSADPLTGYQIFFRGSRTYRGGTSAVAPLMAGLVARINQQLAASNTTAGFVNPLIYSAGPGTLRDITRGSNDITGSLGGIYAASEGWDACTGLGVVDGRKLLALLAQ